MKYPLLIALLIMAGCQHEECTREPDQIKRTAIFMACLKEARQPNQNHEDNNGHLVEACESAAYYQSLGPEVCQTVNGF